jgi:hypothetical protein
MVNLAADLRVVVHLESGEDVVIVRGIAEDLGTAARSRADHLPERALPQRLAAVIEVMRLVPAAAR